MPSRKTTAAIAALTSIPALATPYLTVAPALAATKSRLVTGTKYHMRWGDVQVRIRVKGHRIINVGATYPTERPRSKRINEQAIPMLKQEVLQAQSARIYGVSGASNTSEAYDYSLQSAIDKAHI